MNSRTGCPRRCVPDAACPSSADRPAQRVANIHSLRHAAITNVLDDGVPPRDARRAIHRHRRRCRTFVGIESRSRSRSSSSSGRAARGSLPDRQGWGLAPPDVMPLPGTVMTEPGVRNACRPCAAFHYWASHGKRADEKRYFGQFDQEGPHPVLQSVDGYWISARVFTGEFSNSCFHFFPHDGCRRSVQASHAAPVAAELTQGTTCGGQGSLQRPVGMGGPASGHFEEPLRGGGRVLGCGDAEAEEGAATGAGGRVAGGAAAA